ncbi:cleavage/polyadenylation factor CFT1 NDAI_0C04130 [Naumovozyma dairenensis CBS 421]|uniref:Protein CFT1 n=1 Tax=Naumovozyma dairenensis (strain ATCC 10597 / BCRC 20456 / CBS 421 / NBRC 0211 / NRRL Y-12639) TaxID=1071378 RepID=G0W8G2_NAUDC|nr:hypothetical protein NDAI_0C04130 [Naumovozyma dairenensis CBS 421]CCD24073.1 hypothetical protein NDAI_0C04130 [Naumovozyma dairenensis CBS 421]
MNVYDDVLDPTVVSHSITGHFTTRAELELLVIRTNILSIYHLETILSPRSNTSSSQLETIEDATVTTSKQAKLFLINEFKLNGKVQDIASIPLGNSSSLECILLSTGTAKLSILNFDPSINSFETLSLHYYEEKFKDISLVSLAKKSQLRMDPLNRCLLMFNNDVMALLPLHSNNEDEEEEEEDENEEDEVLDNYEANLSKTSPNKRIKYNNNQFEGKSKIFNINKLHEDVKNISDIQFLNNFNKPTIAVLYQPTLTWAGNVQLNPLPTHFMIFTLDILSENSTNNANHTTENNNNDLNLIIIAKLKELAWDWFKIIPISNGCVVIGNNEIAYIDNTGVLQSIILLNSFADKNLKKTRIIDESKFQIFFNENVTHVWSPSTSKNKTTEDDETLLLMDAQSNLYYVRLEAEGRLLTKFDIINLPIVNDVLRENCNPTCISRLDSNATNSTMDLFIGFLSGDSLVVRLNNLKSAIDTRDEHSESNEHTQLNGFDEEDEDNLYSDDEVDVEDARSKRDMETIIHTVQPFDIEYLTSLKNIGPITSLTVGKVSSLDLNVKGLQNPNKNEFSIVTTSGNSTGSHLNVIQQTVQPIVEKALKFISVTQIWNLKIKNKDKYLVTTDSTKSKSDIYDIDNNFSLHKEGRLRRDATTVYIAMFGDGKRVVQITTNHLYLFDTNFRRLTAIKFDFEVVHVSVMDPYILITVSRGDIKIYELDATHKRKLFRVDLPDILKEMVITSGVILKSNMCNEFLNPSDDSDEEHLLFTFVTADNQIIFFTRQHNDRIFQLNGVDQLKESLFVSTYQLPDEVIPDPSIKQVMINKIGQNNKEEYLTILTFGGEIYQYKKSSSRHSRFFKSITRSGLAITGAPNNAYAKGVSSIERVMHYISDYNGYSVIFITGSVPYMLIREDDSVPRIFQFANLSIVSMARWGKNSIMCVDNLKNARIYGLDHANIYYGNKLSIRKIKISDSLEDYMTLTKITYHEKTQMFLVSYAKETEYDALGEDDERIVGYDEDVPHAKSFQSGVLLINPLTWNVIDSKTFGKNTLVNDMRSMLIQVNSKARRKREYIIAGVTHIGTEDLPPTGAFHIYDITEVVPEPGKPDTNYRLKEVFKEEVRGIVSTVCEISGRFLVNQSQKVMVRDAQEDNSVVPVAFLDIPVFINDAKSFGDFLILGDAMQGLHFIGFDAEPYRMINLGKSVTKFETVSVEFVVNGGDLYFALTDRNNILHVLKYAPDELNSLSGQKLVHCSSFNLFSGNSSLLLLPKNEEFEDTKNAPLTFQTIGGQVDGSIFKVIPLREDTYRRLYVIQQHMNDKEPQLGGLNPRMERLSNEYYQLCHVMRPMLDFNIIRRFSELPIDRRTRVAKRAGQRAHYEIWRDMINVEFSLRSLRAND